MATLSPKKTIAASAGALIGWAAALFGTLEFAYLRDAYSFLNHDLALALAALGGFCATLIAILSRSSLRIATRFVVAAGALLAFVLVTFWGSLSVACANGNCL